METILNIKKVSLVFFIITGLVHLGSGIFISNQLFLKEALIVNKTMDIPFILTGIIYGLSSLRFSLSDPNKEHRKLDIGLAIFTGIILTALILINILVPDLK